MKRKVDTPRKFFKKEIEVTRFDYDDYEICYGCSRDLTETIYKINFLSSSSNGKLNEKPILLCKNCFNTLLDMMSEVRRSEI